MVTDDYRDKRFLIVDDFESFQLILKRLLHSLNAKNIDTAVNATKALALCEENQYDVIFCDFDLGKGQNGLQLMEELRHKNLLGSGTIFIIVTADSSRDAVIGSLEYKPDAYMNKPISSAELQARLIKSLKQKNELSDISKAIDLKKFDVAIQLCDQMISNNSRHKSWCLKTKGQLLIDLKKWKEAEALFKEVLDNRPLFWAQLGYADVLAATDRHKDALIAYQLAYQENSSSLEAYEGAARMLINLGNPQEAQKILEEISHISSRSVSRQKLLADVSKINGDFDTAAKASRKVVRLAENSIHKSAENELELADNLTEAALHSNDKKQVKAYAKEALSTLHQTHKENSDLDIKLQSKLIESRAYTSIDENEKAQKSLEVAEARLKKSGSIANLKTQLELVKSYLQTGHKDKANSLLAQLADEYKDNPEISQKLDRITDEPVSSIGKKEVVKVNKEGIQMFEAGNYLEAVQCFLRATKNFPRHIGIRLNIIQALIFQMKKTGLTNEIIQQCHQHFNIVKGISKDHPQYKRYVSIGNTLKTLTKTSKAG
ncbi:MAG: response regulator [Gammaproteobacteria bacterium]|nr:response regulator [Gammaproteobacteria bacterium]